MSVLWRRPCQLLPVLRLLLMQAQFDACPKHWGHAERDLALVSCAAAIQQYRSACICECLLPVLCFSLLQAPEVPASTKAWNLLSNL